MTYATEPISAMDGHYEYDGDGNIRETTTDQIVYSETGIGEIDLRRVMSGEITWENTTDLFTFDDFVNEIVIPDLEASGLLV